MLENIEFILIIVIVLTFFAIFLTNNNTVKIFLSVLTLLLIIVFSIKIIYKNKKNKEMYNKKKSYREYSFSPLNPGSIKAWKTGKRINEEGKYIKGHSLDSF